MAAGSAIVRALFRLQRTPLPRTIDLGLDAHLRGVYVGEVEVSPRQAEEFGESCSRDGREREQSSGWLSRRRKGLCEFVALVDAPPCRSACLRPLAVAEERRRVRAEPAEPYGRVAIDAPQRANDAADRPLCRAAR